MWAAQANHMGSQAQCTGLYGFLCFSLSKFSQKILQETVVSLGTGRSKYDWGCCSGPDGPEDRGRLLLPASPTPRATSGSTVPCPYQGLWLTFLSDTFMQSLATEPREPHHLPLEMLQTPDSASDSPWKSRLLISSLCKHEILLTSAQTFAWQKITNF